MERTKRSLAFRINVVEKALKRAEQTLEQVAQHHGIENPTKIIQASYRK